MCTRKVINTFLSRLICWRECPQKVNVPRTSRLRAISVHPELSCGTTEPRVSSAFLTACVRDVNASGDRLVVYWNMFGVEAYWYFTFPFTASASSRVGRLVPVGDQLIYYPGIFSTMRIISTCRRRCYREIMVLTFTSADCLCSTGLLGDVCIEHVVLFYLFFILVLAVLFCYVHHVSALHHTILGQQYCCYTK